MHEYVTNAVGANSGWRILGWRMADGSMPLGDYDEVDPELAQIDYLPSPNSTRMVRLWEPARGSADMELRPDEIAAPAATGDRLQAVAS